MTPVETTVLDEFDLDIQIDQTDDDHLPHREHAPHQIVTKTAVCSCTYCCATYPCPGITQRCITDGC
jgi:hypothetical protein